MAKAFKAAADPRGGHIRLYWDIFDSHAWACLPSSAQLAYMALLRQKRSTNNGDLSLPISVARRYGISSEATLVKALRALCAVGLLAQTREGGSTKAGRRLVNLYRLTDTEAFANPSKFLEGSKATNEWKAIKTLAQGREAIRQVEASAAAAETERKTKSLLQKMKETPSETEEVDRLTPSKIEGWSPAPLQKLKVAEEEESSANPTPARV